MRLSTPLSKLLAFQDDAGHRVALRMRTGPVSSHRDVTFADLGRGAAGFAAAMREAGATTGQRVALLMPHGERLITSFFGCLYAGFVPSVIAWPNVKMDPEKYQRNVSTVVARLAAHHLVTDTRSAEQLGGALGRTNVVEPWADELPPPCEPTPRSSSPLLIQFSGGTTGAQKSVPIGAPQLISQLESYSARLALSEQDSIVSWLPLYHDMGLVACLLMPFIFRIPVSVFSPIEWVMDPLPFLKHVGESNATLCWLPNFAFSFMANRVRARDGLDLSSLRAVINCSEPVRDQSVSGFEAAFADCGLREGVVQACYAMAETTFAVTQTPMGRPSRKLTVDADSLRVGRVELAVDTGKILLSCGPAIDGAEIRVVNDDGSDAAANAIGELEIRAPFVMDDYLDETARDRSVFHDGWYRTGDLGFVHDAELYVTGRKKDLIIVGGINVFPEDVEACMSAVHGIRPGRTVAMGMDNDAMQTERLVVIAEVTDQALLAQRASIERALRAAISTDCGVTPSVVLLVPPQWIVKSTAGKISRIETKARVLANWSALTATR